MEESLEQYLKETLEEYMRFLVGISGNWYVLEKILGKFPCKIPGIVIAEILKLKCVQLASE